MCVTCALTVHARLLPQLPHLRQKSRPLASRPSPAGAPTRLVSRSIMAESKSSDRLPRPTRGTSGRGLTRGMSLKNVKEDVKASYHTLRRGRFEGWTRYQMIKILVAQGIELRQEKTIPTEVLYSLSDAVFEGEEMPEKPMPPSTIEAVRMQAAATKIQFFWVARSRNRNFQRLQRSILQDQLVNDNGVKPPTPTNPALMQAHNSTGQEERVYARADSVLEERWVAPNWNYAEMYQGYNHPRKGGPGGEPYNFSSTTLGRYCVLGGCGEQCDLWDEGQVSELGPYGAGVTGYFKFLKWCAWVFGLLAVVAIPQLVINTFGDMTKDDPDKDFYTTTLGNLGELFNTSSTVVNLPYCEALGLYGDYCKLDTSDIAVFYGSLDLFGVIVVAVAFVWLLCFQRQEQTLLDRNTITPADYTVCVTNLPKKITEEEVKRHFMRLTNYVVVSVHFAYDDEAEILAYQSRGALVKQHYELAERIKYLKTTFGNADADAAVRVEQLTKQREELRKTIKHRDKKLRIKHTMDDTPPVCAFVTFDKQEAVVTAVLAYRTSLVRRCFMPSSHLLKKSKIAVQRAPEPSTIIWENLPYTSLQRARRMLGTIAFSIGFIAFSVLVTLIASDFQQQVRDAGGDDDCPDNWDSITEHDKKDIVKENDGILHCYCDEIPLSDQVNDHLCRQYWESQVISRTTMYLASAIVVMMNFGVGWLLRHMAVYEKHHSVNTQEVSMFHRSFALKFINVGIVPLLMSSDLLQSVLGLDINASRDFNEEWYRTSGVAIMIVMILNAFEPHFPRWLMMRSRRSKLQSAKTNKDVAITQDQLNALHLGPDFLLSVRFAHAMVTFFVCWMYTAGMPLMPVIACLSFWLSYLVDKWMFLNYYRAPPRFDTGIGQQAVNMIPFAAILHLALAIWIYGNRSILSSQELGDEEYERLQNGKDDYTLGERATQRHTFPLFVTLCIVIILTVIRVLNPKKWVSKVIRIVCCKKLASKWKLLGWFESGIDIAYTRALERGLIKGLPSYSILQNPKYQRAFNITEDFALLHSRLKSMNNVLAAPSSHDLLRGRHLLTISETKEADQQDIEMQQPRRSPEVRHVRHDQLLTVAPPSSSPSAARHSHSRSASPSSGVQLLDLRVRNV